MTRVSIGLPVYNGERFLSEAIESLLRQTLQDFELIISDNASTDGTRKICRKYSAQDQRIRYFCNAANIGSTANFNRVFELSTAPYFTWAAHDDVWAPQYLERCVQILDWNPSVILAYSKASLIDGAGKHVRDVCEGPDLLSPSPSERLQRWFFQPDVAYHAFFGVIRTSLLAKTSLLANCAGNDDLLLAHLVLIGKFYEVPECLFFNRDHAARAIRAYRGRGVEHAVWFDPANQGKFPIPLTRRIVGWFKAVKNVPMSFSEKLCCLFLLVRWTHWNWPKIAAEIEQSSLHWAARAFGAGHRQ